MPIVLACKEGAVLNTNGACRPVDRQWLELPETLSEQFLLDLVLNFNPEILSMIVLAMVTGLVVGFGGGMLLGAVRKAKNL